MQGLLEDSWQTFQRLPMFLKMEEVTQHGLIKMRKDGLRTNMSGGWGRLNCNLVPKVVDKSSPATVLVKIYHCTLVQLTEDYQEVPFPKPPKEDQRAGPGVALNPKPSALNPQP